MSVVGSRSTFGKVNYRRFRKKGDKPVKNKEFNRKVSVAMNKLAEVHHYDGGLSGAVDNTFAASNPGSIFGPVQNVTDTGRVGDFVRITSIHLKYSFRQNTTATIPVRGRITIFQWFDETAPTLANVYQTTSFPLISASHLSYDRIRNDNNLKVLYDKMFIFSAVAGGTAGYTADLYLKNYKKKVYFNSGATTPTNGSIYIVYFADTNSVSEEPDLQLQLRTLYVDY